MLFLKRLSLVTALSVVTACSLNPKDSLSPEEQIQAINRQNRLEIQRLLVAKRYADAIVLLKEALQDPTLEQNSLRLQLAETLFKAEQLTEAKQSLLAIDLNRLNKQQRNQLNLLYSQIYLKAGDAEQAVDALQVININALPVNQKRHYHDLAILAYSLTGRLLESVQERIALEPFLADGERKEDNKVAILKVLLSLPKQSLKGEQVFQKIGVYSGWVELANIERSLLRNTENFKTAISYWSEQYPEHPAQSLISSGYFTAVKTIEAGALGELDNIAVFLPESGAYAVHAQAIKAGFKAAYYQASQRQEKQVNINFYDTQSMPISALYEQAMADDVQLVIGPLNKQFIRTLAADNALSVPVLALNFVEGLMADNLYQFALSPLDDVQQVVSEAIEQGHQRALIIAPNTVDGKRIAGYFKTAWESRDGKVLAIEYFKRGMKDFSVPIKALLNIQASQTRYKQLKKILGGIHYNPRRRQDADVIFMVANHREARLINPQFYHQRAGTLPVYGLSGLYNGHQNITQNIDLKGVTFCGVPWLFEEAYQGELSREALSSISQKFPRYLNLVAFGLDAYGMLPYLSQLSSVSYRGASGVLSLNAEYRVIRELVCAKFNEQGMDVMQRLKQPLDDEFSVPLVLDN